MTYLPATPSEKIGNDVVIVEDMTMSVKCRHRLSPHPRRYDAARDTRPTMAPSHRAPGDGGQAGMRPSPSS